MHRLVASFVIATAIASAAIAQTAAPTTISGVARITDGDTIRIGKARIRLDGFDAPEAGRRCAGNVNPWRVAKDELRRFAGRNVVSCEIIGRDGERLVGRCSVNGIEIGEHMTAQGLARDWPYYSCGRYAEREAVARAERRGFWGMSCPALWGRRDYERRCPRESAANS